MLADAERKLVKDPLVKEWLADLRDLFYDADDILDEFATKAFRCKLQKGNEAHSSKVQKLVHGLFASFNPSSFLLNREMMSKLEGIRTRLNDLEKQRSDWGLTKIDDGAVRDTKRLQPTCLVDGSHVYGREKEKVTILELLSRDDENGGVSVIPIFGMGGIDKTSLAQLVYNDPSMESSFDQKAWVCVSEEFDAIAITKKILQSITDHHESYRQVTDLNLLKVKLKEKLIGKKLLLVLDDVWNENYEDLCILLTPFGAGTKILLTTRSSVVSSLLGTLEKYELKQLSEEGCLSIFTHHALTALDFSGHPELKEFGEKVVKKCGGLPLAAKAIGGLLRTSKDLEVWKDVSESEIWDLAEEKCGVIPAALRLSYHHLPSHLKRCFAYCSIFPKDYEFGEEETILLWRAEGFLQQGTDIKGKGREYFQDLVSRSFFQISSRDKSRFVMHDLINDLAQSVAGRICFGLEGGKQGQFSHSTRHSSYSLSCLDGIKKFEVFNQAKNLRTFLPLKLFKTQRGCLTNVVLNDLLPKLKCLSVLSLSGYCITKLPNFFENLKHLRYLDFSYTNIKVLPDTVCTLHNLETLILQGCSKFENLPEIENLVNLDYLDISGASSLQRMPLGIGELTKLQKLPLFVLSAGEGDHVRKLKNLTSIKGEFCLSGLENIFNFQDAREAKLSEKLGIDSLELKWSAKFDDKIRIKEVEEQVLNFLCPQKKLSQLMIKNYGGSTFSPWIADSSLDNLSSLKLINCRNCKSLPSIGKLPQLKHLSIERMDEVNKVGVDFFGENRLNAFTSLESLQFSNMPNWKEWDLPCEVEDQVPIFPRLVELSIVNCPQLLRRLPNCLQSLQKLAILGCRRLVVTISTIPLLRELHIDGCEEMTLGNAIDFTSLKIITVLNISRFIIPPVTERIVSGLTKLEFGGCNEGNIFGIEFSLGRSPKVLNALTSLMDMHISGCLGLVCFADNNLPPALKKLVIWDCKNLQYLVDDESMSSGSTTSTALFHLDHLEIWNCPFLICLSSNSGGNIPNHLQRLTINNCSKLNFLFSNPMMLPMMLKKLEICNCQELECIAQEFQETACLESIQIEDCEKIKSLPRRLHKLSHLQEIIIQQCPDLNFLEEFDLPPASNLRVLSIESCQNFGALPKCINNFIFLRQLRVCNCSVDLSFPEEGGVPTKITLLAISNAPKLYRSLVQWGFHRLSSLEVLLVGGEGCSDVVSFPQEDTGMMLPSSLTKLFLKNFGNLEYMFSKGFQTLTFLLSLLNKDRRNVRVWKPLENMYSKL